MPRLGLYSKEEVQIAVETASQPLRKAAEEARRYAEHAVREKDRELQRLIENHEQETQEAVQTIIQQANQEIQKAKQIFTDYEDEIDYLKQLIEHLREEAEKESIRRDRTERGLRHALSRWANRSTGESKQMAEKTYDHTVYEGKSGVLIETWKRKLPFSLDCDPGLVYLEAKNIAEQEATLVHVRQEKGRWVALYSRRQSK